MFAPDRTAPRTAAPLAWRKVMVVDNGTTDASHLAEMVARLEGHSAELLPLEQALDSRLGDAGFTAILVGLATLTRTEIRQIEGLRAAHPTLPVILASPPPDSQQVQTLIRMGVQDWLPAPVDPDTLAEALAREQRRPTRPAAQVHAVIPTMAGAGATSLAVTLADLLATETALADETVALVDLDFTLGPCAYRLNLQAAFPLDSVINDPRRIDAEMAALIRQRHGRGFHVYSYACRPLVTHVNSYEFVLRLLDVLSSEHDYLVLDLPYHETDWLHDVLMGVDSVTLVSEVNLPAIKHALDMVQVLQSLQRPPAMLRTVLNKDHRSLFGGHHIDPETLQKLFGTNPFTFLPDDGRTLIEAMDRGITPVEVDRASDFVSAVRKHLRSYLLQPEAVMPHG